MMKRVFRYGVALLLAVLGGHALAAAKSTVNIEEHPESVAPLVEGGAPPKFTVTKIRVEKSTAEKSVPEKIVLEKEIVVRAVFAKQIVKREPVDEITSLSGDVQGVYFFTELENMADHTAVHRWEHDGQRIGYSEFKVAAPHWRAWSYRKIPPGSTGTWKVKVLNTMGEVIGEKVLAPQTAR